MILAMKLVIALGKPSWKHRQPVTKPDRDVPDMQVGLVKTYTAFDDVLRNVARSFYLTLRILPYDVGEPISIAYMLARAADTIADTKLLPPDQRMRYIVTLREQFNCRPYPPIWDEIEEATSNIRSGVMERGIIESLPKVFSALDSLPETDKASIFTIVMKLTQAMEMDLTTFPLVESSAISALKDSTQLELYTYLAAGCVGEFWTQITTSKTKNLSHWDVQKMSALGIRFGKALQVTNILRDLPRDLLIGRCYIPEDQLKGIGLSPKDLLKPTYSKKARPVLKSHIGTALEHYCGAEEYIIAIPRRCFRLRLATLLPVLIGLATLERLVRNEHWLEPSKPSKATRKWVYTALVLSVPFVLSNFLLRHWIHRIRKRIVTYTSQI